MERGGQECWFQYRLSASRLDESHAIEPADFVCDADGFVKREQVGAGTEEHMLAVIHNFAGARMFVRRRASAKERAAFEHGHVEAAASKGARRRQTGESASDDYHCGRAVRHQMIRCKNPLLRMVSFSRVLRLTLRVNTS